MDGGGAANLNGRVARERSEDAAFDLDASEARLRAAMEAGVAALVRERLSAVPAARAVSLGYAGVPGLEAMEARLRAAFDAEAARRRRGMPGGR